MYPPYDSQKNLFWYLYIGRFAFSSAGAFKPNAFSFSLFLVGVSEICYSSYKAVSPRVCCVSELRQSFYQSWSFSICVLISFSQIMFFNLYQRAFSILCSQAKSSQVINFWSNEDAAEVFFLINFNSHTLPSQT